MHGVAVDGIRARAATPRARVRVRPVAGDVRALGCRDASADVAAVTRRAHARTVERAVAGREDAPGDVRRSIRGRVSGSLGHAAARVHSEGQRYDHSRQGRHLGDDDTKVILRPRCTGGSSVTPFEDYLRADAAVGMCGHELRELARVVEPDACKYAFDKATAPERFVSDCDQVCPDNGYCTLDPNYVQLYEMANGFDARIATDAGPTGTCPQWPSAQVTVTCHTYG